jgi:hypothetical protein
MSAGRPKVGWSCTGIEDAGEAAFICEYCGTHIRFIHEMSHPDYPDALRCGVVCAGRMQGHPAAAHAREALFKSSLPRRARWLSRKWRRSRAGNEFLNTGGFNVVVYPVAGGYGARVLNRWTDWERRAPRVYPTEREARLAAFDVMVAKEAPR